MKKILFFLFTIRRADCSRLRRRWLANVQKTLFFVTALFALQGCGTIVKLVDPTEPYSAYAGAKYDLHMAGKWGLPIIDLPLSFLLDTALLPYVWAQE